MIETAANLRFSAKTDQRMQLLMDRNNEGHLTPPERDELDALVELSETISLIRAQALHVLDRIPPCQAGWRHATFIGRNRHSPFPTPDSLGRQADGSPVYNPLNANPSPPTPPARKSRRKIERNAVDN
jgi:hypothetical protein